MKLRERIRASLFVKILLVFIVAYVGMVAISSAMHFYLIVEDRFQKMQRNSANYCNLLAKEIGFPPDTTYATHLADSLNIGVRIQAPGLHWASRNDVPLFGTSDIEELGDSPGSYVGLDRGLVVEFTRGDYQYTFRLERREEGFIRTLELHGLLLLLVVTIVLGSVYLIVRRILKPIQVLDAGVQEVAGGNLDHTIVHNRRDELGDLMESFNIMAARLRMMLQARDRLLLDVSHELRSPLTRMKVATEFLEDDSVRKNLSDDIHQMETMLTEMLETERLKSEHGNLHLKDVDLAELLQDASSEFEGARPGIELQLPAVNPIIQGDADRLRILLRNVLGNALKFSPDDADRVALTIKTLEDGSVLVTVKDAGEGIPKEDLPFIFEPFYRVDKSRAHDTGGYGLGLSLCKTIVEHHGGSIDVTSTLGKGTTVFMQFPAVQSG